MISHLLFICCLYPFKLFIKKYTYMCQVIHEMYLMTECYFFSLCFLNRFLHNNYVHIVKRKSLCIQVFCLCCCQSMPTNYDTPLHEMWWARSLQPTWQPALFWLASSRMQPHTPMNCNSQLTFVLLCAPHWLRLLPDNSISWGHT